jgi:DNA-binding CsgD family transcriptional regulator
VPFDLRAVHGRAGDDRLREARREPFETDGRTDCAAREVSQQERMPRRVQRREQLFEERLGVAPERFEKPPVSGYLLKERVSDVAVLLDALRRITEGECVLDPTIVARLIDRRRAQGPLEELTDCERQVLALIAEGRSDQAICEALFVSPKTIEGHIRQIFLKLGSRTRRKTFARQLIVSKCGHRLRPPRERGPQCCGARCSRNERSRTNQGRSGRGPAPLPCEPALAVPRARSRCSVANTAMPSCPA